MTRSRATAISLLILALAGARAHGQPAPQPPLELPRDVSPPREIKADDGIRFAASQQSQAAHYLNGDGAIQQTAAQPYDPRKKTGNEDLDFSIQTELPGPNRVFRRESEAQLYERIRQDSHRPGAARVIFPEYAPLTKETYQGRQFERMTTFVEPMYVNHCRLYFEQPNFERHGWDLGILTPAINLGMFYYDTLLFPYHFWTRPCDCCDSSAGKCLPGDPTPLYLYWEEFSWTGLAGQAGTVVGLAFFFP